MDFPSTHRLYDGLELEEVEFLNVLMKAINDTTVNLAVYSGLEADRGTLVIQRAYIGALAASEFARRRTGFVSSIESVAPVIDLASFSLNRAVEDFRMMRQKRH